MAFERIKRILCEEFEIDEADISLSSSIAEDLDLVDTDLYDFVMSLEDEFEAELPDEALEEIETLDDLVRFFEGK